MLFQHYVNEQCDGCGHPVRMGQCWTGEDFAYLYLDGVEVRCTNQRLLACPFCGHAFARHHAHDRQWAADRDPAGRVRRVVGRATGPTTIGDTVGRRACPNE